MSPAAAAAAAAGGGGGGSGVGASTVDNGCDETVDSP